MLRPSISRPGWTGMIEVLRNEIDEFVFVGWSGSTRLVLSGFSAALEEPPTVVRLVEENHRLSMIGQQASITAISLPDTQVMSILPLLSLAPTELRSSRSLQLKIQANAGPKQNLILPALSQSHEIDSPGASLNKEK